MKKYNLVIIGVISLFLISCKNTENKSENQIIENKIKSENNVDHTNSTDSLFEKNDYLKIADYFSNFSTSYIENHQIIYLKDGVVYFSAADSNSVYFIWGLNRCECKYKTIDKNNRIILLWNTSNLNCNYNNHFKNNLNCKYFPKEGEPFAEVFPIDSGIYINYLYADFFSQQNLLGKENEEFIIDSVFPSILKIGFIGE